MQLIMGLVSALGAALAGFLGHVAAHDFCEASPRLCKKLINSAALRLAKETRDRYLEEWLADLEEREGVFSKFKHALDCLLCAGRMRRESSKFVIALSFRAPSVGTVPVQLSFNLDSRFFKLWVSLPENSLSKRILSKWVATYFVIKFLKCIFKIHRSNAKTVPSHMDYNKWLVEVSVLNEGNTFNIGQPIALADLARLKSSTLADSEAIPHALIPHK